MDGRATTNILLAIIAGCLLFGGGVVLSSMQTAGAVAGIALVVILGVMLVGWIIYKVFGGSAMFVLERLVRDVMNAKTPLRKSAILLAYVSGLYLIAFLVAIPFYAAPINWNFKRGLDLTMMSGWGAGLAFVIVMVAAWFTGKALGLVLKAMFRSPEASYRIDAVGTWVAGFSVLPLFLAFRAKPGQAYNEFLWGIFLWVCTFFVCAVGALVFVVAMK